MIFVKEMMPDSCSERFACRQDSIDGLRAWQCNLTLITFVGREELYTKRDENCPLIAGVHNPPVSGSVPVNLTAVKK